MVIHFKQPSRLKTFWEDIQQDLKLFGFILVLVCLYRAIFMAVMHSYINPATPGDEILLANWMGLRLSLKTAGGAALVTFLFATVAALLVPRLSGAARTLRLIWGTLASFVFNVLFVARFPFYNQFHTTYNSQQVMAGTNEKLGSVLMMMIQDYGLIWRMAVAIALTVVCFLLLRRLFRLRPLPLPGFFRAVLCSFPRYSSSSLRLFSCSCASAAPLPLLMALTGKAPALRAMIFSMNVCWTMHRPCTVCMH